MLTVNEKKKVVFTKLSEHCKECPCTAAMEEETP